MNLNSSMKECLEKTNYNLEIENHPFFTSLNSGKISKSEFLKTQIEFSHLVGFFNRPMAQVIANIPDEIKRMAIVDNLWEEHGRGVPENVHGRTILTLIERLGGDINSIDDTSCTSNIQIFNQALRGISAFEDYRFATAVFGGIERSFVDISTQICSGIAANKWLPVDRITHYALHKEIDIEHAEDFLKVSNDDWENPEHQKIIKAGIELGGNLFLSVYTRFYNELNQKIDFDKSNSSTFETETATN